MNSSCSNRNNVTFRLGIAYQEFPVILTCLFIILGEIPATSSINNFNITLQLLSFVFTQLHCSNAPTQRETNTGFVLPSFIPSAAVI